MFYSAGQFSEAAATWKEAAQSYAAAGDLNNQAFSLSYLSIAYQYLNQWSAAQQAIEQSLSLLRSPNTEPEDILLAHALNTQASLSLHSGQPEAALETWKQAEGFYQAVGDTLGMLGSQINQAQALQTLGFYRRSKQQLDAINQQLTTLPDSAIKVVGLRNLGVALQVIGDLSGSREVLFQSADIARQTGVTAELSATYLSLALTAMDWGDSDAALIFFEEAESTALNPSEFTQAQLGRLSLYADHTQAAASVPLTLQLYQQLIALPPSRASVYNSVNFVNSLSRLEASPISIEDQGVLLAQAVQSARALKDSQAEAHALKQWGALYEQNQQWSEALKLTEQSLKIAQSAQASDIVAQSAWQQGQLLKHQGQKQSAIAAYNQAVKALQSLRGDLVAISSDVQFSYRKSVEPVYRELVDLLLEGEPSQAALIRSRELIEALQLAELDNFFREACLDVEAQQIDQVDPQATIIYPIILPDRLAVIQSSAGQPLRYHTTPIAATAVKQTLQDLLTALHPSSGNVQHRQLSAQVYDWLIRPAEASLTHTETLVFVPDGLLRNIPMSALYNGEHYLIEDYAVALSPGLQLMSVQSPNQNKTGTIVAGISEARHGFSALPAVAAEVSDISQIASAKSLLNQQFTSEALSNAINNRSANIVHLATHGQFSSRLEDTFLLTWEGRLDVKALSELLKKRSSHQNTAIDLLVLSACDTA
ncbi:MAG: CHAT domain-containing protein, partial [Cyanobacteria bacterium J06560_2]